jgi:trk system potassium uptake protein TrkH
LHWASIRRVFGFLLLLLSVSMLLPLVWAVYYGTPDWSAFLASAFIVGIPGIVLMGREKGQPVLGIRDVYVITSGGWIMSSVAAAIPLILSGVLRNPVDALFETVSGFTTTGATVMTQVEVPAAGVLFWRSLLHWFGGMGIILLFLAFIPRANQGSDSLFKAEVPGMETERLTPRLRQTAVLLWKIYGSITAIETIALTLAGMTLYDALIHTFGTVATGGFSNKALSVGAYPSVWIHLIILFFMFVSGVNFGLYYRAIHTKRIGAVLRDAEFRTYTAIALAATLIIVVNLIGEYGVLQALHHGTFQVVSVMTTTGYATLDFDRWPDLSRAVLVLLMFVGACSGSTGGSVKVVRYIVMVKSIFRELGQMVHARAVLPVRVGDRVIPEGTVRSVLVFISVYMCCALAGTLYMLWIGLDMVEAISAVAATLGNIGPGLGSVGPALSFGLVPASGKVLLTFLMLIGRLEIFTVLVTLTPSFWKR